MWDDSEAVWRRNCIDSKLLCAERRGNGAWWSEPSYIVGSLKVRNREKDKLSPDEEFSFKQTGSPRWHPQLAVKAWTKQLGNPILTANPTRQSKFDNWIYFEALKSAKSHGLVLRNQKCKKLNTWQHKNPNPGFQLLKVLSADSDTQKINSAAIRSK